MSLFVSLRHFPEEWGKKARCPICKHGTMQIMRFDDAADQLHCLYCGVSFEVEEKGEHLFFIDTPLNLENELKHRWVTRSQLIKVMGNNKDEANRKENGLEPRSNGSLANPLRADAVKRARTLVELGNSPEMIRQSLSESLKLTDFAIEEIITDALNVHKIKLKKRFRKILLSSIGVLALLTILIFLLVYFL